MARVGLLEDNARISKLCATMLTYAGHQVTTYVDAIACLRSLISPPPSLTQAHSQLDDEGSFLLPIDVLILDLHLPDLSGLEVLHILRSSSPTNSLPLIVCTAATHAEVMQALRVAPNATLVEKPFRLQALLTAISSVL